MTALAEVGFKNAVMIDPLWEFQFIPIGCYIIGVILSGKRK